MSEQRWAGQYALRAQLIDMLRLDLVGPVDGPDEIINEKPMDRYATGVLYPLDAGRIEPSQTPDVEDSSGEDDPDPPVELANMRYPSSMGLTFSVDTDAAPAVQASISVSS